MTFAKLTGQKILFRAIYFRKSFWCNAFGNRSLSFLLVRYLAPRSLFLSTPIFPSTQKPKLSATSNSTRMVNEEPLRGYATFKSLFINLFYIKSTPRNVSFSIFFIGANLKEQPLCRSLYYKERSLSLKLGSASYNSSGFLLR